MTKRRQPYQFFAPLRPEHYAALENSIRRNGVQDPIVVDEAGCTLAGHTRREIAERLGLPYETVVRHFDSEDAKLTFVFEDNLCRRQMSSIEWGLAFVKWCELKGVGLGQGTRNDTGTSASVAEVASDLGVSQRTARHRVAEAKAYEALPEGKQQAIDKGTLTLTEARREVKKASIPRRMMELPKGKYRVFYADPPWQYRDLHRSLDAYSFAENHYDSMSIEQLCELPIKGLAVDDAVLFMWVTFPKLNECWPVIDAWGFAYKTAYV